MHTEDNDRFGHMCCLRRDDRWSVSGVIGVSGLLVGRCVGNAVVRVKQGQRD